MSRRHNILSLSPKQAVLFRRDMECSSCVKQMTVPGSLCSKGHNTCYSCEKIRNKCKICGEPFTCDVILEGILEKCCVYSEFGCEMRLPHTMLHRHKASCEFRPLECPLKNTNWRCMWQGHLQELREHISITHFIKKGFRHLEVKNILARENVTALLEHKNNIFVFNIHVDENAFHSYLQIIGDRKSAGNIRCRLKVTKDELEKIMFTNGVWSYATAKSEILSSGECASLPFKVFRNYLKDKKDMFISLKIYKVTKNNN
jgi:Seven in absentia protein family.